MARVLVVEDDDRIGGDLRAAMSRNGHEVVWQRTGGSAVAAAREQRFDLVILDLGLPDVDGVEVCRQLRDEHPAAVIVMLTARSAEMDVIVGLESGADDYLTKPFRTTELLARVRAHLRRLPAPPGQVDPALHQGVLTLDLAARRCTVAGRPVDLRPKEFDLLATLLAHAGRALTRTELMAEVWDENWVGSTKTLDVHIAALRRRLADAADEVEPVAEVPVITTLRGHGYRLEGETAE